MDERTRDEHAALNGCVYPVDDPFWDAYYPPNDWNCRCDAEPTDSDPEPASDFPELKDQFNNNVGKTGDPFPDHPYYDQKGGDMITQQAEELLKGYDD